MDVQLKKATKLQSSYKKKDELKYLYKDKTCQDTIGDKKQKKIDKNCQTSDMWSVTNTDNMQLPAVPNEYRRLCSDKGCQYTRHYMTKGLHFLYIRTKDFLFHKLLPGLYQGFIRCNGKC